MEIFSSSPLSKRSFQENGKSTLPVIKNTTIGGVHKKYQLNITENEPSILQQNQEATVPHTHQSREFFDNISTWWAQP
jgi:hypothetical protein